MSAENGADAAKGMFRHLAVSLAKVAIVTMAAIYACDQIKASWTAHPTQLPIVQTAGPNQARFLPYAQATGLALDTKTGLLCHTFDQDADTYIPTGRGQTSGVVVGSDITLGHYSLDTVPLCVDLSQKETDTVQGVMTVDGLAFDAKIQKEIK